MRKAEHRQVRIPIIERRLFIRQLWIFLIGIILCGLLILERNYRFGNRERRENADKNYSQIHAMLEEKIGNYYYASYLIQNSREVIEALERGETGTMERFNASLTLLSTLKALYPITLYAQSEGTIGNYIAFQRMEELEKYPEFELLSNSEMSYIWLPEETSFISGMNTPEQTIPLIRKIGSNKAPAAYQMLRVSKREITTIISPYEHEGVVGIYAWDTGRMIAGTSEEAESLAGFCVKSGVIDPDRGSGGWIYASPDGTGGYLKAQRIAGTDWLLLMFIPVITRRSMVTELAVPWMILFMAVGLVLYLSFQRYNREVFHRILLIRNSMDGLLRDEFVPVPLQQERNRDEIDTLSGYYNETLRRMQKMMEDRLGAEKEKRRLELDLLQEQISPHFLYNTLEMIRWEAIAANAPHVGDMILELSDFYKLSLNGGQLMVTVKDEIEHVKHYLSLQNYRFDKNIKLDVSVSPEVMKKPIPRLTLQPLVENSFQHGFLENDDQDDMMIEIFGRCKGDTVTIAVRDNGRGMSAEEQAKLLTQDRSDKAHSFGVYNIHTRIRLYCGENYGLRFESREGEGTTVYVDLKNDPEIQN